ncbi:MAG: SDR family oxidoreductase, partial [Polyangiaceae bacterium]
MVLVTGATGKIGSHAVHVLADAKVPTRALLRDPAKAKDWSGVEIAQGNLDDAASVAAALAGVDNAVLITTANSEQEIAFIAAAKNAGVQKVVKISSMGADATSKISMARGHAQAEAALKASGLKWTILRPGTFAQNFLQFADSIKKDGKFFASVKQGRVATIDVRDIAEVAVKAVTSHDLDGRTIILTGDDAISYEDAARILGTAIGKKVDYVDLPPEKTKKGMLDRGMPAWLADELVLLQENIAKTMEPVVTRDVQKILGHPARKFDDFARD